MKNHQANVAGAQLLAVAMLLTQAIAGCGDDSTTGATSAVDEETSSSVTDSTAKPIRGQRSGSSDTDTDTVNDASTSSRPKKAADSETNNGTNPQKQQPPLPVFRASDNRPRHDDRKLAAVGIHLYESKRLKLYTDIDPQTAEKLPPLIDAAYNALEEYFGKLPPNRERTDFQITGYLMGDQARFREAGLIPRDLRPFPNGQHRGAELWMHDQSADYYRRHLLIHESTHCFMQAVAGARYHEELPVWYWEGMAELFGTHRFENDGTVRFRVMPDNRDDFVGFGRIKMIRDAARAGGFKSLDAIATMPSNKFLKTEAYAWAWGLCKFLDTHPGGRQRFRELGRLLTGKRFKHAFGEFVATRRPALTTEWRLFATGLEYGYDIERAVIDFQPGRPLKPETGQNVARIRADRGWQSSRLEVQQGTTYEVSATGEFTLAQKPKPWLSQPQGISFDYFGGRPLGLLLATIHADDESMLRVTPVGRSRRFVAAQTGTLYFRLNDSWSRLADNSGTVAVEVRQIKDEPD